MATDELQKLITWNFSKECEIPADVAELLVEGEVAECAYKTMKNVAVFTNKRLIVRDSPSLDGKKVEMYTLPYGSITMYSSENAGNKFEPNEIELWTRAGKIKIKLDKDTDIRKIDKLIASHIL